MLRDCEWLLFIVISSIPLHFCDASGIDPCLKMSEVAKMMCQQLRKWDNDVMKIAARKKIVLPPGMIDTNSQESEADFATVESTIYQCMDLKCLCYYLDGKDAPNGDCELSNGEVLEKSYRKEYRQLTADERQKFHDALQVMKKHGEYDKFTRIHRKVENGAAHSGPAFLLWHREFIKRVEFGLKQVDPSISLPYIDWTLDAALENSKDSIVFSEYLMGDTSGPMGYLVNGPFTNWRTIEGHPGINRSVGLAGGGKPMQQKHVDYITTQTSIYNIYTFSALRPTCRVKYAKPELTPEYAHGEGHSFVGGDMGDIPTAANDPIFYLHHAFLDLVYEEWRHKKTRSEREFLFPGNFPDCASSMHYGKANLYPFVPMKIKDALTNKYTDNLYSYAPRPTCSVSKPNGCDSEFLFCDKSHGIWKCASKLKPGAKCNFYTRGEEPCYNGKCVNGYCVLDANKKPSTPRKTSQTTPKSSSIKIKPIEECFNENKCCSHWAATGHCQKNPGYMNQMCGPSCGQCQPNYRLVDDCTDRHSQCDFWARIGECKNNEKWMVENCRKSCNKCAKSREEECSGIAAARTTTTTEAPKCENSECSNENVCCPYYSLRGDCTKASTSTYMLCNCRVSCGLCEPTDYSYGSCIDYDKRCRSWSLIGECQRNPWMSENCRTSCRTCYTQYELDDLCRGPTGSISPVAPPVSTPKPRRKSSKRPFSIRRLTFG